MSQEAESRQEQSASSEAASSTRTEWDKRGQYYWYGCERRQLEPQFIHDDSKRLPHPVSQSINIIVIGRRRSGKSTLIQNMKLDLRRHKGGPMRVKGGAYALVQLLWSMPETTASYYETQSMNWVAHGLFQDGNDGRSGEPPTGLCAVVCVGPCTKDYNDQLEAQQSNALCVCVARHRCPSGDTTWFNPESWLWTKRLHQPPDYLQLRDDRA
jgi:hypothetical protein